MAQTTPNAITALSTVTVMKDGGESTLTLTRRGDGAVSFTDLNGNVQIVRDIQMTLLFQTLSELTLAE